MKTVHQILVLAGLTAFLIIQGCGVSFGSATGVAGAALAGVAGAGKPLVNGTVTVKDRNGAQAIANLAGNGAYSVSVANMTPPFRLKAEGTSAGKRMTLYSVAVNSGTAHVNPFSNIAAANIAGVNDPKTLFDAAAGSAVVNNITTAAVTVAVNNIRNGLLQAIQNQGFADANVDPITGTYAANGEGLDRIFDFMDINLDTNSGALVVKSKIDEAVISSARVNNLSSLGTSLRSTRIVNLAGKSATEIQNLLPKIPLGVAKEVSVVKAKQNTSQSSPSLGIVGKSIAKAISTASFNPEAQYFEDETHYYVEERSMDGFKIINEILCMVDQTGYTQMLNKGAYTAQVDLNRCESDQDSAKSAAGQNRNRSSAGGQPDYELWTVESTRLNNDAAHIVKAWVHQQGDDEDPPAIIRARIEITEGSSEANPYGIFTMNFKAHPVSNGVEDTTTMTFRGLLKTQKVGDDVQLRFVMNGGFENSEGTASFDQQATLVRDEETDEGVGRIKVDESFQESGSQEVGSRDFDYSVAFNSQAFLRSSSSSQCFLRNSFDESAWSYGLYDSAGNRVNISSGFPIRYTTGAQTLEGWVGFWGVWFPDDRTLPNGATVTKVARRDGEVDTSLSVFSAPGRLIRHTREVLTLGDILNIPLNTFQGDAEYQVTWDGSQFQRISMFNESKGVWESLSQATPLTFSSQDYSFNFYSPGLGGSGHVEFVTDQLNEQFQPVTVPPSNSTSVFIHREEVIFPDDPNLPSQFACYEQCLNPGGLNGSGGNLYLGVENYQNVPPANSQRITYNFSANSYELTLGTSTVAMTQAMTGYPWGVRSGPMIPTTQVANLTCDWQNGANQTCAFDIWSEFDVFYTYETGTQPWNQFTTLKDGANFISFDKPIRVRYDRTLGLTSTSYFLNYEGFGDLHGIPGQCVNPETGESASCDENSRYVPEFSIPEGTTVMARMDLEEVEYLVKPLEVEQRMSPDQTAQACSSLTLDSSLTLPSLSEWVDPSIGTEPAVTTPVQFIGGVQQ